MAKFARRRIGTNIQEFSDSPDGPWYCDENMFQLPGIDAGIKNDSEGICCDGCGNKSVGRWCASCIRSGYDLLPQPGDDWRI